MEELQPEDGYVIEDDVEDFEDSTPEVEEDSGSAPDTDEGQEKQVQFTEEQQKVFNSAVGSKVAQARRHEAEAKEYKRRVEELEAKIPQQSRPYVPTMPDPFAVSDEEYKRIVGQRERALIEQAQFDSMQQQEQMRQRQVIMQQQQVQQQELNTQVQDYSGRATKLGIKAEELQVAGNTVAQFGMDNSLVQFIIADEQGPLITKYLSENLTELDELTRMSPTQAAVRIATSIKQKAASTKPKVNGAPDPLNTPRGAGSSPKPKGPKGATFE